MGLHWVPDELPAAGDLQALPAGNRRLRAAVIDDDRLLLLHRLNCQRFNASLQLPRAPVSRHKDGVGNRSVDGHFVVLIFSLAASRWVGMAAHSTAASTHLIGS
jgi:hypothetical protein